MTRWMCALIMAACLVGFAKAQDIHHLKFVFVSGQLFSGVSYLNYPRGTNMPPEPVQIVDVGSNISKTYEYSGPARIQFVQGNPEAGGKLLFSFDVRTLKSETLFIVWQEFSPEKKDELLWRCLPVSNWQNRINKNRITFINLTKLPLAAKLDKKICSPLPPLVPNLPISQKFDVNLMCYWEDEDRFVIVRKDSMMLREGFRHMGVFFLSIGVRSDGRPSVLYKLISDAADASAMKFYEAARSDM